KSPTYVPPMRQEKENPYYYIYRDRELKNQKTREVPTRPREAGTVYERPKPQSTQSVKSTRKDFFVVAGSYTTRENAEVQYQRLIREGFKPNIQTTRRGIFRVICSAHGSKLAASQQVDALKVRYGIDAWVLKRD
ncbi:MAG: SPOR domain-containing protein, partial [Bacteroidota bacterium]